MRPRERRGQAQGPPHLIRLSPPRNVSVPLPISTPTFALGWLHGPRPGGIRGLRLGCPCPILCPGPRYSGVSLVAKLRPCPPRPLQSLNPLWDCLGYLPLTCHGDSPDFRFLETVVQLGSLPVTGGQPLPVSRSIGSTAQRSGPPSVPSLLAGLSFPPGSSTSWVSPRPRHLVSAGGTSALGCAEPLLQATLGLD